MNQKHFSSLLLCAFLCLIGQMSYAAPDLTFYYFDNDDYVAPGDYPIQFTVHNSGDEYVTSFVVNWSVNGGSTQSYEFTGISIPNNVNLADFEIPGETISINGQDSYDISLWISEINDIPQTLSGNNQSSKTIHRLDAIPQRKVMAEKVTATWCPSCPSASVVMEDLLDDFPDNLLLAYLHKSDAYEPPQYDEISAYYGGLPQPSGLIDRYVFPVTYTSSSDIDDPVYFANEWAGLISTKVSQVSPVHLSSTTSFNNATNQLTVDIDATFLAAMEGEYRFNAIVLEDHIIANQSGSGGGSNYDHRYTVRDMLGGAWGDSPFFNPTKDSEHNKTYTYTVPSNYDSDNLLIYVTIQEFGNVFEREFVNMLDLGINETKSLDLTPVGNVSCAAPPAPQISSDITTICQGESVNLNANLNAPANFYYQWQRNGSDLAGENAQNINTSIAGTYSVYLTDGEAGAPCNSDESNTIFIALGAQPSFNTTPTVNGTTVTFSTNIQGVTNMAWSFGNGDSSLMTNPTYTYSEPGTYFVCPTAFNDCGEFGLCIPVTIPYPFTLDAKVFLEGPYMGGGIMAEEISNFIPLDHPFSEAPYNYTGDKPLGFVPNGMVDWVLVEARSGTPSGNNMSTTTTVETRAGLLMTDGSIVDLDGETPLGFRFLQNGTPYHFVIRHRNHLDIISANAVTGAPAMSYDFTNSSGQVAGTLQVKPMGDGTFGMYGGDYNQDGVIQTTDYDQWQFSPAQVNVYSNTDGTLDGVVQATDYDLWFPNKAKIGHVEIQY